MSCFFFFQAEDGIRDLTVTGVQTCALPILGDRAGGLSLARGPGAGAGEGGQGGRALMAAITFCVVAPETERLDPFVADQLPLSRTVAAPLIPHKPVTPDRTPPRAPAPPEARAGG